MKNVPSIESKQKIDKSRIKMTNYYFIVVIAYLILAPQLRIPDEKNYHLSSKS